MRLFRLIVLIAGAVAIQILTIVQMKNHGFGIWVTAVCAVLGNTLVLVAGFRFSDYLFELFHKQTV